MSSEAIDVTEMLAVHDAMRREYASLPLLVKSIADDDVARADVVADHIELLDRVMELHHAGEDELLWPLVRERMPEAEAMPEVEEEHRELNGALKEVVALAETWRRTPSATNRAALHTRLIAFEKALLMHLAHEERESLPLMANSLTVEEFGAFGTYVRAGLAPQQRSIVLGMIVDAMGPERGNSVLGNIDAHDREEFERSGRAEYRAYKGLLLDGWG